tara:strand:+ start:1429 stop:1719 length:291 start_codon:yes stop_codon:yes gene_type:complete
VEITFGKPYWEDGDIREFDPNREDAEYVWHRDGEDREIEVLEGEGWQFQYQNCLPYLLEEGMVFEINKDEYHRLIKGVNTLKCRIVKKCQINLSKI